MPKITLVIPMYNENGIIKDTANTLSEYMKSTFEDYEIIFSDDGSRDGCGDTVRDMALPCVRVISYGENKGKGAAIKHGVLSAEGDIVMFTDADLAYGTDVIKRAYDGFLDAPQTDVLIGSRNLSRDGYEGYTAIRKLMSRLYIKLLGMVGGFSFSDSQCGCKAFRTVAAKEIFSRCETNGFAFDLEAILWAQTLGFRVEEMSVKIINHRESKIHIFRDTLKMLRDAYNIRKRVKKQRKTETDK